MKTEHSGNCGTGEGHQHLVMVVTVPDEHVGIAKAAMAMLRSGMLQRYLTTDEPDTDIACSFYGPVAVSGADYEVIEAIADSAEGCFDTGSDDPAIIRNKAMLAMVRRLVEVS